MNLINVWRIPLWVLALNVLSCSNEPINDAFYNEAEINIPESKPFEVDILNEINNYRVDQGLSKLSTAFSIIKSQTANHTDYMIENHSLNHDHFAEREQFLAHYGAVAVGENVAFGYTTAEALLSAWLKSPGHKRVIEGHYTHFQLTAKQNEDGHWFFTNIFVRK